MFIFERLISLGFFFLAILIACYLMSRIKGKQYRVILALYLLVLTGFAWCYEPYITADLYRLRQYVEAWINLSFEGAFDYACHTTTPSWILFSYFTNQIGNQNWMQSIACLWCYGNIFIVLSKVIDRFDLKRTDRGCLLFYIMSVGTLYLQTISGIRTMLGFSIVFLCVYREYFEGKSAIWDLPFYIIAGLFHPAVLVLVGLRFIGLALERKSGIKRILNILFSVIVVEIGLYYAYDYLLVANDKAVDYMTNDAEYTYMWEYLIGCIEIVQILFLCYWWKKGTPSLCNGENWSIHSYVVMNALFTLGCICFMPLSYAIFRRFTIFATMLSLPILGAFLQRCAIERKRGVLWARWAINLMSLIIMFISFARGDLCGYKFFLS